MRPQANGRQAFWQWVHRHERAYKHDVHEFEKRFRIFLDNLDYIVDYNSKHTSHWVGGGGRRGPLRLLRWTGAQRRSGLAFRLLPHAAGPERLGRPDP